MKKVIIIGAGPAGITAANELLKDTKGEYDVTILEETERIGGISQTVRYNGNRMDIGGHRFFSKSDEVMNWWSELMPVQGKPSFDDKILGREKPLVENGPDPEKDDKVILCVTEFQEFTITSTSLITPLQCRRQQLKIWAFSPQ